MGNLALTHIWFNIHKIKVDWEIKYFDVKESLIKQKVTCLTFTLQRDWWRIWMAKLRGGTKSRRCISWVIFVAGFYAVSNMRHSNFNHIYVTNPDQYKDGSYCYNINICTDRNCCHWPTWTLVTHSPWVKLRTLTRVTSSVMTLEHLIHHWYINTC